MCLARISVRNKDTKKSDMTKEQAIQELCSISVPSGDFALITENTIEALSVAIDALREPSLPEGLDEASKEFAKNWYGRKNGFIPDTCRGCYAHIQAAVEFGAKWQASQGHTINAVVNVDGFYRRFIQPDGEFPFEYGDKLVVQIRKR
jgi:hypothetical protein